MKRKRKNKRVIISILLILCVTLIVSWDLFFALKSKTLSTFFKKDCSKLIPENPYLRRDDKFVGFEWSMIDRGSRNCEAYNEPFILGCMEYIRQEKTHNKCLDVIKNTEEVKPILLSCSDKIDTKGDTYCLDGL